MTYQEFKNKYTGVGIDYDKYYGKQCWDLAQQYITECLCLPSSILSGCGLVSNMLKEPKKSVLLEYFDEVSTGYMIPGDIVIWEYGHIALFDSWDGKSCWYFSQNPNLPKVMVISHGGAHAFRVKSPINEVTPYKVKITASVLNIRDGYNTSYKINGTLTNGQVVEINATYNNWGRLSNGKGWISLAYTEYYLEPVIEPIPQPIEPPTEPIEEDKPIIPTQPETPVEEPIIEPTKPIKKSLIELIIELLKNILKILKGDK